MPWLVPPALGESLLEEATAPAVPPLLISNPFSSPHLGFPTPASLCWSSGVTQPFPKCAVTMGAETFSAGLPGSESGLAGGRGVEAHGGSELRVWKPRFTSWDWDSVCSGLKRGIFGFCPHQQLISGGTRPLPRPQSRPPAAPTTWPGVCQVVKHGIAVLFPGEDCWGCSH